MKRRYILAGFLFLLVGAYLDNARGPLLPLFRQDLGLSYTQVSLFLTLSYPFAIALTLALNPLFRRYGEIRVSQAMALFGIVAALLGHFVSGYGSFLALGVLLGSAIAVFGTLCNVFVIKGVVPESRSRFLCGLHMMYGFGSFLAPLGVREVLALDLPWAFSLSLWPVFLVILLLIVLATLPKTREESDGEELMIRPDGETGVCILTMSAYVGGEVVCSMWMSAYFVEYKGYTPEDAALVLSGFFVCMLMARAFGAFWLRPRFELPVLWGSLALGIAAQVAGHLFFDWGFALSGIVGIFFPVFLGRMSGRFPKRWRQLTVWILAGMQVTLLVLHSLMGGISDVIPIGRAYWLPVALLGLAAFGLWRSERQSLAN